MFHQIYSDLDTSFWRFFCETRILACERTEQAVERLLWLVNAHGAKRPVIITDSGVRRTVFFSTLFQRKTWPVFEVGSEGNPAPLKAILQGETSCDGDLLIAVGGGSVLDAAKCLAACFSNNIDVEDLPQTSRLEHGPLPLVCIPTTFGTGSEVNMYAHLAGDQGKVSFRRDWLTPAAALLVGEAGLEMPSSLKYLTAVDAWVHVMEALTLARERSPIQDALLRQALALHKTHFSNWLQSSDPTCGLAMATAACLGGLGIHNARTGLIHSLAVPFAARFHLPHQVSLLPFIRPVIMFNRASIELAIDGDFDNFLDWVSTFILGKSREFDRDWSAELRDGDLEEMARECARDHVLFKENPQPLSESSLLALYTRALV